MALGSQDGIILINLVTTIYVTWRNKVDDVGTECEAKSTSLIKLH